MSVAAHALPRPLPVHRVAGAGEDARASRTLIGARVRLQATLQVPDDGESAAHQIVAEGGGLGLL